LHVLFYSAFQSAGARAAMASDALAIAHIEYSWPVNQDEPRFHDEAESWDWVAMVCGVVAAQLVGVLPPTALSVLWCTGHPACGGHDNPVAYAMVVALIRGGTADAALLVGLRPEPASTKWWPHLAAGGPGSGLGTPAASPIATQQPPPGGVAWVDESDS